MSGFLFGARVDAIAAEWLPRGERNVTESAAFVAGREHGVASGSWVLDGDSTVELAREILAGIADGDPEILDMAPSPLSGEWAGESVPELSAEYGLDLFDDEIASEFEAGFSDGYWSEVERSARALVGDDVGNAT